MGSLHRQGSARAGRAQRHYVANLLWRGLPRAANDNYAAHRLHRLLPAAAGALLFVVAILSAVF